MVKTDWPPLNHSSSPFLVCLIFNIGNLNPDIAYRALNLPLLPYKVWLDLKYFL